MQTTLTITDKPQGGSVMVWTAVASGAQHRFSTERASSLPRQSAVAGSLCRRSPKRLVAFTIWVLLFTGIVGHASNLSRTPDHDYDVPTPGSYQLPVVKAAADGEVVDHRGRQLRLSAITKGRVTVMSFIYTRCAAAKACPMATGVLLELHRQSTKDKTLAQGMRLVSMSFDPENDTPQRMAMFANLAGNHKSASDWRFITTASQTKLQPILAAYGQAVNRKDNPNDPTGPLNHTLRVFLIDEAGNIRNIYSSGTLDVRLVLADVRTLLLESAAGELPLTAAAAVRKAGQIGSVAFQVKTAARVTNITDKHNPQPLEILLTDASNGDNRATPVERASVIARIPVSALEAFGAADMDELARRFEGNKVIVTGMVATEPHPFRHDAQGRNQLRPVITVTDPGQIRTVNSQQL